MDKLSVSNVNAHVRDAGLICILEDHNIAGLEVFFGYVSTHSVQIFACAVRGIAQLLQNIVNKAGAVKTAGGCAAGNIGTAQIFLGFCHDCLAGDGYRFCCSITAGSVSGRSIALQCRCAGSHAGGLAAPVELGGVGRIPVLVRNLGQIHIIRTDIADLLTVNYLEPALVQADDVNLVILCTHGNLAVGGGRTGAEIYGSAVDFAVDKFCIFLGQNI